MMAVQRFFDEHGYERAGVALRRGLASPQLAGIRIVDGVKIPRTWPAILDVATHEAIVAELNKPRGRGRPAGSRWLLSGFTVCGRCGQPMRAGGHRKVKRSVAPTGPCRYSADITASRAFYEDGRCRGAAW
jgi:hypothetical protein